MSNAYRGRNYHSSAPAAFKARMQEGGMNYQMHNPRNYSTNIPERINYPVRTMSNTIQVQGPMVHPSTNNSLTTAGTNNVKEINNLKKSLVRCQDCNLDFTSQVVLDAHLQGARHAKQMKSKNILETLRETNVPFSKEEDANGLKCNVCSVYLNSLQQLQTHLNGNRHQKKMSKGDWNGKNVISKANVAEIPAECLPRPAEKNVLLSCKSCNKFFNSSLQLNEHLTSQKHLDRLAGRKSEKTKRFSPYYKERVNNYGHQPLTNNFISGGWN
ncbi:zinc finger protein 346-like [Copidosoma floridanum]|uniref:zinc finger protein 346-like n=1 Tax=Copidosoma floridanum TaxID=29053 RepID=UPI0006C973B8|nr:zinc finger protein 346-like [Copidosoma floridanum]XP_014207016.1 zinc finger protein 346-like [Copidosoma floridanum]XP_014207017.1 zinc finger protein 346-like [Copidosoma floridanum]XP_014207018.1 zinc finger protein 346-like [Copidosoma floridanum]XP_023245401.1 zinc finger protein 346-like [Copidosoma floridanum]